MKDEEIVEKFGVLYHVNEDTFKMGIHHHLSEKTAQRFRNFNKVLDTCTGAGFIAIQLAKYTQHVIAVDINPTHLKLAKENARVAGMKNIIFILGDITDEALLKSVGSIDGAILDPDWARPQDRKDMHVTKLSETTPPADILFRNVYKKTNNLVLRLPKEMQMGELEKLPHHEIEKITMDGKLKFFNVYFGSLIK